jgi:leucyl aminopeptidase
VFDVRAPGADDNGKFMIASLLRNDLLTFILGSGSVALLEILRILLKNNFKPKRTIEFHWYAAEEFGLLGSQDIAVKYKEQKKDDVGMLQLDMIGYVANKDAPHIGLESSSYVNNDIKELLRQLIKDYAEIPLQEVDSKASSDHASWTDWLPSRLPSRDRNQPQLSY